MDNPFESLNRRLDRLENLIQSVLTNIIPQQTQNHWRESSIPKLIKVDQAAELTGYKRGYIYELIHRNAIPFIKRGRSVRFDPQELEYWMRAGRPNMIQSTINRMREENENKDEMTKYWAEKTNTPALDSSKKMRRAYDDVNNILLFVFSAFVEKVLFYPKRPTAR